MSLAKPALTAGRCSWTIIKSECSFCPAPEQSLEQFLWLLDQTKHIVLQLGSASRLAKMIHQQWPCTLLLNNNSLSTLSLCLLSQGVHWQGQTRQSSRRIVTSALKTPTNSLSPTLKIVTFFHDGTGCGKKRERNSSHYHIIPRIWRVVTWGFLWQNSHFIR